jgi:hypothetical protein
VGPQIKPGRVAPYLLHFSFPLFFCPMLHAVTLVHKAAMPIARHAVNSFSRHFSGDCLLRIHSDGSLDASDETILLEAAGSMPTEIVRPADRAPILEARTAAYPLTRALLTGGAYFTKLQLPVCETTPYFYFDSDIVWLRPVTNLAPSRHRNAFSTESWTWYHGVRHDREWIRDRVPRRVNSGFYHLGEPFPHERMENMLARGLFDPKRPYNTDQEIMAYLYRDMDLYHPEDLKRSRRGMIYDLATDPSAALHFPGGMWKEHMNQIAALTGSQPQPAMAIRHQEPISLTHTELLRMRLSTGLSDAPFLRVAINHVRKLRGRRA